MLDILPSFEENPEFVTAFRFMFWALFLGLTFVAWKYVDLSRREKWAPTHIPMGVALVFLGISIHQFYYWMWHRAKAQTDEALISDLSDIRHITSLMLVVMSVGGLLYMSHIMRLFVGKYWMAAGLGVIVALWGIGYIDARWL